MSHGQLNAHIILVPLSTTIELTADANRWRQYWIKETWFLPRRL